MDYTKLGLAAAAGGLLAYAGTGGRGPALGRGARYHFYVVDKKKGVVLQGAPDGVGEEDLWLWIDEVSGESRKNLSVWTAKQVRDKFGEIKWASKRRQHGVLSELYEDRARVRAARGSSARGRGARNYFSAGDRVRSVEGRHKGREGAITTTTWENACYVLWDGDKEDSIVAYGTLEKVRGGRRAAKKPAKKSPTQRRSRQRRRDTSYSDSPLGRESTARDRTIQAAINRFPPTFGLSRGSIHRGTLYRVSPRVWDHQWNSDKQEIAWLLTEAWVPAGTFKKGEPGQWVDAMKGTPDQLLSIVIDAPKGSSARGRRAAEAAYSTNITYWKGLLTFKDGTKIKAPPGVEWRLEGAARPVNITYESYGAWPKGALIIYEDGDYSVAPREIDRVIQRERKGNSARGRRTTTVSTASDIPKAWGYVTATDTFMSGWGQAKGKTNKVILLVRNLTEAETVVANARARTDMKHVSIRRSKPNVTQGHIVWDLMDREDAARWYEPGGFGERSRKGRSARGRRGFGIGYKEERRRVREAMSRFPETFHIRNPGRPGSLFRIHEGKSFVDDDDRVSLVTQVLGEDGEWGDYARASVGEVESQIVKKGRAARGRRRP